MSERTIGPYASALKRDAFVVTSGQVGIVQTDTGPKLADGGFGPQFSQSLSNLGDVLHQQGVTLTDVIKATVFLTDIEDFAEMNELWLEKFGEHRPTRSTVVVAGLPVGALVEIEAWAYKEPR